MTTSSFPHVDEPASRAAAAPAPRERFDIYVNIHKALRLCATETLAAVGRLDASDPAEVARVASDVKAMLAMARMHLEKEEALLHPLLEVRAPGSTAHAHAEHRDHEASLARVEEALDALLAAPSARRAACALALYRTLALHVAADLVHMHHEETVHNAALWASFGDDEIAVVEARIVGSLPPDAVRTVMRWMVPAIDPRARAELLAKVRASLPKPAFDGLLAFLKPLLPAREQRSLDVLLAA